jgi:hypothetical protein
VRRAAIAVVLDPLAISSSTICEVARYKTCAESAISARRGGFSAARAAGNQNQHDGS